jgi:hypothetical protein
MNKHKIEQWLSKYKIKRWLSKYNITNYTINDDLTVDVDGNVDLRYKNITKLPFQFGNVSGYFDCSHTKLSSLKNCPISVQYFFSCACNRGNLTSLQYCPIYVGGDFYCHYNSLSSIKELLEITVCGNINIGHEIYLQQTPEYKLIMKLQSL